MALIILLIVLDVLFFISMNNSENMEKPEKKTGGRWLFFGFLLFGMGLGNFILRKTGMPQLNTNTENGWLRMLVEILDLFCRFLMDESVTSSATSLLIDGAILLVIAIAKKILRVKQIKSWDNHEELNELWDVIQCLLVVLLPTLSSCFLTDAFVEHLTGIENARKIIFESGLWGISATKDFDYRYSVSVFILNYFCMLGLMMYWRSICLIPKSSSSKIRMSLILLPCVFLLNYVLVRVSYVVVAVLLPLVVVLAGISAAGGIIELLGRLFPSSGKASNESDFLSEMIAMADEQKKREALRGIEACYRDGDFDGINSIARNNFTREERDDLSSYCNKKGVSAEACDAIRRN